MTDIDLENWKKEMKDVFELNAKLAKDWYINSIKSKTSIESMILYIRALEGCMELTRKKYPDQYWGAMRNLSGVVYDVSFTEDN